MRMGGPQQSPNPSQRYPISKIMHAALPKTPLKFTRINFGSLKTEVMAGFADEYLLRSS
jgi:hypothetical protein